MATADPSIYNALMQPRKTAFDYANEFEQQGLMREQMGMARQQNALTLDKARREQAQAEAANALQGRLRADLGSLGQGATDDQIGNVYLRHGLVDKYLDIRKTGVDVAHKQAQTAKETAEATGKTWEQRQKERNQAVLDIANFASPQDAAADIQRKVQSGSLPPEVGQGLIASMQGAGNFDAWRMQVIRKMMSASDQVQAQQRDQDFGLRKDQFGETIRHNKSTEGLTARGQNLTDARGRESNTLKAAEIAAGGKPPPGYRWKGDGTLEAIPGGPGDKLPEAQQKQVVGTQNLSNAIKEYRSSLANFSKLDALSPNARAEMGTKYNNMLLQAKEAYNLGVLNGPDYQILQSVVTDPRSVAGVITSKGSLDAQAAELDRIMGDISAVSGNRRPQDGAPQATQRGGSSPRKPSVSNW